MRLSRPIVGALALLVLAPAAGWPHAYLVKTRDGPKTLSVGVPPLAAGTYTVKFRVLSVDGHVVEDRFSFTIRGSP